MEYQLLKPLIEVSPNLTPVEQVFANRNIDPSNIDHYLHTTVEDILSPALLDNINYGAKMLISHINAGDKIFIQVDPDVDGFTSAAALINYLNIIAPGHTQNNISYRLQDGKQHGLILDVIPKDAKLVIAPDSGR